MIIRVRVSVYYILYVMVILSNILKSFNRF